MFQAVYWELFYLYYGKMKKLILIFFFIGCAACFAQDDGIKIHFIDVGEGEAILIQARDENALVDTGNILNGYKLAGYLKENNVKAIDHLIITHPHLDHMAGVFFIMPKFTVKRTYDNGSGLTNSDNSLFSYYEKIFRSKENYRVLKEGDVIKLGELTLAVIWPPAKSLSGDFNYNSLVIMLNYKNFRCLLTGDINNAAETELLKRKINLGADVLKVAHHGANDATSRDFIKRVRPKFAIISVDNNNKRGYPAESVLDLLEAQNIKTYRTDKNGSVLIEVNNKGDYTLLSQTGLSAFVSFF